MTQPELLLVDDEPNILRALVRLLRRDGYTIRTAASGQEGLLLMMQHPIGVIISDQRMPAMSGVEFLSQVKDLYPNTVRMVLSGYTDLNSITDAVNKGAIYKFLTKPWDDAELCAHVRDAFAKLLQADSATSRPAQSAGQVPPQEQAAGDAPGISAALYHAMMQHLPLPVVVLDAKGGIALMNQAAMLILGDASGGNNQSIVSLENLASPAAEGNQRRFEHAGCQYQVHLASLPSDGGAPWAMLCLIPSGTQPEGQPC